MDFVDSHDPHDEQMLPYVLGTLSDLDAAALESPRLSDLMLLGRRPGDTDTSVPEVERLHDRLGNFLLEAETSANEATPRPRWRSASSGAEGAACTWSIWKRRAPATTKAACASACGARSA
jgi:hypothetical protein